MEDGRFNSKREPNLVGGWELIPGRERFPAQKIFQPRVKDILFAGQQLGRILSAKIVVAEIHVHSLTHSAWERFSVQIFCFPFRAETST